MGSSDLTTAANTFLTMNCSILTLLSSLLIISAQSSTVPLQLSPAVDPSQYYFGASNPQPCCRSNYPEEFGSCQVNDHCLQATAPYCSAYGYCTQIQRYGYNGCVQCQYQHAPVAPGYQ